MGNENNQKTVYMMLFFALIFVSMFQLCYSDVKLDGKMNFTWPKRSRSNLIFPVQGNVYPTGGFHTVVTMGNPPLPYFLDIDTGSNLTWVQCQPGPNAVLYQGPHPPYKPNRNSKIILCKDPLCAFNEKCNSLDDHCEYDIGYEDRLSSLGVMLKDSFLFKLRNGTAYTSPLGFGCGYNQQLEGPHNGPQSTDGVLGFSNGKSSIVTQLSKMGFKNALGHCFSRHGGGFFFIGDHAAPKETVWTEMLPDQENHYLLGPADLIVGNALVAKGITVALDSGSTYTYLNSQTYQATLAQVNKEVKGKKISLVKDETLPICWKGKNPFRSIDEVKNYFSPLVLRFNKARFLLPPESYLIVSYQGNVCLGILNGSEIGLKKPNLIGAISFQDKLLIYDNEKRWIGWAPFNCH
ncbi:hypothetical protein LguiA_018219 [Lonicera macranthoides]